MITVALVDDHPIVLSGLFAMVQSDPGLYLAPKTIRNRVSEIVARLGVANRDEAIAVGSANGLGSPR